MLIRRILLLGGAIIAIAIGASLGCSGSDTTFTAIDDDGGPRDAAVETVHIDDDASFLDAGDVDACAPTCSEDLHRVLDCTGKEITTCEKDKACLNGVCDDPCAAADAAHMANGCEFYAMVPPRQRYQYGQCYVVAIANTWPTDVSITVEYEGVALDVSKFAWLPPIDTSIPGTYLPLPEGKLPPGKVALLFLASFGNRSGSYCPAPAAITDRYVEAQGTAVASAFHIVTDRPVAAYDFYPYLGGSFMSESVFGSSSTLLSTGSWTTNYIAQTPYPHSVVVGPYDSLFLQIVAKEDATTIDILPTSAIVGNEDAGIAGTPKGQVRTFSLNKGQALQLVQDAELAGSIIESSKPIGVWGGAMILSVDVDQDYGDWTHRQIVPITSLGSEYAAVNHRSRDTAVEENPPWRIVGVVDGTELSYSPRAPPGAPTYINRGEVITFSFDSTTDGGTPGPFVVRSQDIDHPFYLWGYMSGASNVPSQMGDPEWVNVVPTVQYSRSYLFFTDPSYPETSLVVVRRRTNGTFEDVVLDCAGALDGWHAVDDSEDIQYTRLDLVRKAVPQHGCVNGRHTITSEGLFTATVWGWAYAVSYAYPVGVSAGPVNSVSVPVPK